MNIIVMGAGAIGSFFGGLLSKHNNVIFIGRKEHVKAINEKGLKITGKTNALCKVKAVEKVKHVIEVPDLILFTVKSYDTKQAVLDAKPLFHKDVILLSFQNGLTNYEIMKKLVSNNQIVLGITSHGVQFSKPGEIIHQGVGSTIIGDPLHKKTNKIDLITSLFEESEIPIKISKDILSEIWKKAIVNAAINPLTAIFSRENGYLLKNPILTYLVEEICNESVLIAQQQGLSISSDEMISYTKEIIKNTEHNHSSMLQSIEQGKKTEIDQITGKITEIGIKNDCSVTLNLLLTKIIKKL